ncbi:cysteine hydrolase family protein [Desulfofalx alkaliphila]|uniref:cysteine hydrolase family protein n=1 Tax=Desulfofalx alkaliphila TaxID=105483 RepID=UPI0004E181CA|nr:isochorismatase family cysteine hydrolase [Desulfofalx alkaliphila]
MKRLNREEFIQASTSTLVEILDQLEGVSHAKLSEFEPQNTVLIIIDMINGFVREGALKSPRAESLIPVITDLGQRCQSLSIPVLAFADCHTEKSPEFDSYPSHCLAGSSESQLVSELQQLENIKVIPKNSTNGFLEREFQEWLQDNPQVTNFIVVGVCTDICIQQFTIALKAYFNIKDRRVRVVVPINGVDTYDGGIHNGDLMQVMALFFMMGNGVEIVSQLS